MSDKEKARDFLELVIKGKIDEAYKKYIDMNGKHHNVYFAKGFETLNNAMKENQDKFPNKKFVIKNIISEGDLVAVHSHLDFQNGEKGMVTVHIFRFENGKIIELWDCGQAIPQDCPNEDGAF